MFLLIGYYEIPKLIPMGYSSDSLEGLKYTEVVQRLKESGFSNVHTKERADLTISRDDEENLVTEIKLIFGDSFDENTKYPSNLWITVVYHTVELYASPLTSKEAKGMNYLDVIDEFEKAGFVNVTTNVKYDIVTGWLTDDGEVKSVSINGDKKLIRMISIDWMQKFLLHIIHGKRTGSNNAKTPAQVIFPIHFQMQKK